MDSPARCVNPKLTQKINGENTLTFTMYYQYWNDSTQKLDYNPFNGLMANERKVKLRLGAPEDASCQWFDFIIKNVQENSETRAFTYTCKDQFVNELSKTGFELELDNELENNMGTIVTLAENILEGSDWKLDKSNTSNLKQYKEEPLYEIKVAGDLTAEDLEGKAEPLGLNGKTIYCFYSSITEQKPEVQFLYTEGRFKTDDDLVIDKEIYTQWILKNVGYNTEGIPNFAENGIVKISESYRGQRLVRQAQTKFDSNINKYVGVYKKDGKEYYGYTESEYISSNAVTNYVSNSSNFTSTSGWQTDANKLEYSLEVWPKRKLEEGETYQSYIRFRNKPGVWGLNSGIMSHRSTIEQFTYGEKYILRIKYKHWPGDGYQTGGVNVRINKYTIDEQYKTYKVDDNETIFWFDKINLGENGYPSATNDMDETGAYLETPDPNYIYMAATCNRSVSKTELTNWDNKYGIFFAFAQEEGKEVDIFLEDVQIFPYETYTEQNIERLCVPGGRLFSEVRTKYVYYEPNTEMTSIDDLVPVYSEYQNDTNFIQQYNDGADQFTKVRSISAKESNRFNLIQDLCETFECWMRIRVNRNNTTGQIYYGKDLEWKDENEETIPCPVDELFRQQKFVYFKESVGNINQIGFRYGVNSKSIQRTIDSAAIVSKMIVKDNANEFAPNGFCSIAQATENPTGENFLISFDHYVRHKLLNFNVVTNDLYTDVDGYLGYYKKLKQLNAQRNTNIDIQSGLLADMANYESIYTTYKTSYDSALEEVTIVEMDTYRYLTLDTTVQRDYAATVAPLINGDRKDDTKLNSYYVKWCQCQNVIAQHKPLYEKAKFNFDQATNQFNAISEYLKKLAEQKRALNLQFYKKYSRFIQEGSWIKEDYVDHNLYFLDAESTLHTSSQPKVTYNISVIDVKPLSEQEGYEDFKHYDFQIGDKSYIEDVEFFGWSLKDTTSPYREEIIISEIINELDVPEKNQIKVQNYKTQFEDLFSRITASTQQAEFHTGEYARAASVVETDGTIVLDTLQNSFANNALKLSNARDQSVVWDESGITTISLSNPSEMVRIISGGIFLSTDGGESWKTGVTGSGINTSYLTAGQINTNEIYIMNGNNPAFRWDEKGLAAYWAENTTYNTNRFVRFDHNGLYGILDGDEEWTGNVDEIHNSASFALTWKGFSLKNDDGSVRISTDRDIQVLQGESERIRIGRLLNGDSTNYGIRIKNAQGNTVMETDDNGELWLRNKLQIGTLQTSRVEIGYLPETRKETINGIITDTNIHEVIHAGDMTNGKDKDFIVYEDGRVIANYIEAKGGKIGNMSIESVEKAAYEVVITSNIGNSMHQGSIVELTAHLYYGGEEVKNNLSYQWYDNKGNITGATDQKYNIDGIQFNNDGYIQYGCKITVS